MTLPGSQKTDLVTFTIKINGEALGKQYQVQHILVANEINRIPQAKLAIFDGDAAAQDFSISNEDTFIPGAEIDIAIGYHSDESSVFSGIVVKHSLKIRNDQAPLLLLDCRDKAVRMTIARKNKYFYDTTDSDAAGDIIDAYNLDHDIEDTTVQHEAITQFDCTDWDFLLSRMEANGKLCTVSAGSITAKKPDLSGDTVLDAVFGATMLEFDADLDARNQYGGVTGKTWDYSNQDINSVDAEEPDFEENGNLSSDDLSSVMNVTEYDLFIGEDLKEDELQGWADARLQKARLSRCRGRVRITGFATLLPGDLINLGGVGDRFNGKVYVSAVRQEVAGGSWTTDIQFGLSNDLFTQQPDLPSPQAAALVPPINGLQIGIVTQLQDDPDSENRIRVRLPIIGADEDGVWTRVATLDAGDNRGSFFLPEIDDEVVVGFLNNDPRHPVVLGMLNSSAKPAPLDASDQNDEKGYVSRSGMKMIFNDDEKSLKIETPAGKKVTISEQDGVITIEDENNNKISMDDSAITLESGADIKLSATGDLTIEAQNITLSPSQSFSLSAGGSSLSVDSSSATLSAPSVSVEGSGTTTVKGGIVMIN